MSIDTIRNRDDKGQFVRKCHNCETDDCSNLSHASNGDCWACGYCYMGLISDS